MMEVSFSDRLSNILSFQRLLDGQGPDGGVRAKKLEDEAHAKSESKVWQSQRAILLGLMEELGFL
jgi:hypothetical protein